MTVSIIVPVYNASSRLRVCIDSLVSQTLNGIEIILINDASTDNSLEIINEYKQGFSDRIIVIDLEKNRGPGGARNAGILKATGEFVGFVDSDDTCDPQMFEKLYQRAVEESADVVDCDYYISSKTGDILTFSNRDDQAGNLDEKRKKSLIRFTGRMWTKIIKRDIFISNNLFFPENILYEDNELMPFLVVFVNKLAKIKEPLYYYYLNPTSTIHNFSERFFERLITTENLKKRFVNANLYQTYKEEVDIQLITMYYLNTLLACVYYFHPPRIDRMFELRSGIKNLVGLNYKNNSYYHELRLIGRIAMTINDISPHLLVLIYSYKRLYKWMFRK